MAMAGAAAPRRPGAGTERRVCRGRARRRSERGRPETGGEKGSSCYADLGSERDGSGRRCLRVLDGCERRGSGTRAGSRGRARRRRCGVAGLGAGRRRHGQQATDNGGDRAGVCARGNDARGACRGWSGERDGERTRERELGSASAHAHALAAHEQSEGRAEGEREIWAEREIGPPNLRKAN